MGCRTDAMLFILCEAVVLHVLEGKRDVNFSSSLQLIKSGGQITILVNIIKPRQTPCPRKGGLMTAVHSKCKCSREIHCL